MTTFETNALELKDLVQILSRIFTGSSESYTSKRLYPWTDRGKWCRKDDRNQADSGYYQERFRYHTDSWERLLYRNFYPKRRDWRCYGRSRFSRMPDSDTDRADYEGFFQQLGFFFVQPVSPDFSSSGEKRIWTVLQRNEDEARDRSCPLPPSKASDP